MSLVVDASVAIKWVVAEDGHPSALALPDVSDLVAPDFILVETANIMWKKVRRGELVRDQAVSGLSFIRDAFGLLVSQVELIDRAFRLSLELDHPTYDCLYIACAELRRARLLTADRRLANVVLRHHGVEVDLLEASP